MARVCRIECQKGDRERDPPICRGPPLCVPDEYISILIQGKYPGPEKEGPKRIGGSALHSEPRIVPIATSQNRKPYESQGTGESTQKCLASVVGYLTLD